MNYLNFGQSALVLISILCVLTLVVLKNWRFGMYTFFVWLPFEDFVRKFAGNDMVIYFVKDFIIAITYFSFVMWSRHSGQKDRLRNPIAVPLALWFIWSVIQVFNPSLPGLILGPIGLRMSFIYVPLLYLGYHFFATERTLRKFARIVLLVALVVGAVGLGQLLRGPEFLNPSGMEVRGLLLTSTRGTEESGYFSYMSSVFTNAARFGRFSLVTLAIVGGIFFYARSSQYRRLSRYSLLALIVIMANLLVNGSRALFLVVVAFILAFVWMTSMSRRGPIRAFVLGRRMVLIAIIGLVSLLLVNAVNPRVVSAITGFYGQTLRPDSQEFEVTDRIKKYAFTNRGSVWGAVTKSGVLAHGTGSASQGQQYLGIEKPHDWVPVEGGYAAIAWEHGIIGVVLVLWWAVFLLRAQYRVVRRLRDTRLHGLGVGIFLWSMAFLFPLTFMGMQVFQDFIPNAYFWFWSGVIFKLPDLIESNANPS
ncbi:MAG: hypothetical protein ABIJ00_15485 [Candidatus Eisenbacteria bacterium]